MKRLAVLLAALSVFALQPAVAFAQWDGGPGSRPHQGQARGNRLSLRGGGGAIYPLTILQRTNAQSINNNTDTAVSWDAPAVQDDLGAFSSSSPTYVTVPGGITHMRVTYRGNWSSNSTGARFSKLAKTNNTVIVENDIRQAAFESSAMLVSRWYTVAPGETYGIMVSQQSGGALNFAGNVAAYGAPSLQFEWAP